jgi:ubiquinol-cytochrome c reductase cytochrome c1 subunit
MNVKAQLAGVDTMKKLVVMCLATLALWAGMASPALAQEHGLIWDKAPDRVNDIGALQNGAKLFVNYCLNCHSAAYMRYNRMRDIGLTEDEIKKNLLFATDKVGDVMKVSLDPKSAKDWFGAAPPDLTVVARSRAGHGGTGADYLYTYLRTFYRDDKTATGWNNLAFPNVAMPNVLWEMQGQRVAKYVEEKDPHDPAKTETRFTGFETTVPGAMSQLQFDEQVADLVAYLQWMGEPAQNLRVRLGVWVLLFLGVFTLIAWRLNAAYWRDVK